MRRWNAVRGLRRSAEGGHVQLWSGRVRRKRFLALGVAGLAVLGVSLGVSFAGDTGTTTLSVSGGSSSFVFPVANDNTVPAAVTSLKYTPASGIDEAHVFTAAVTPSWQPVAGSAGSVTTAGDLALIDATTVANAVVLNMYVTNLAALQQDYSSYALPINVYSSTCSSSPCSWAADTSVIPAANAPLYLTNSAGVVTLKLPTGKYYSIAMDTGGAFYTISTTASGGALSPSFYFVATAT